MECCDRCGSPVDRTYTGIAMAMSGLFVKPMDMHDLDADMILCHRCVFALAEFLKGAEIVDEVKIVDKRMGTIGNNNE